MGNTNGRAVFEDPTEGADDECVPKKFRPRGFNFFDFEFFF
jgi:hypothetical protein